jgi:PTH1 family peptidyl-tRNA hydrolase
MPQQQIHLIVGLGNPGTEYAATRHNVGAWFVERLAHENSASLRAEKKFYGNYGKINLLGSDCLLLIPTTFMNLSGQAVQATANFYKITPQSILIAHDDLDLPTGTIKLKQGGGHGGHNGLRNIISRLGSNEFIRLRIGIGHPGHKDQVTNHVLSRTNKQDEKLINAAIDRAIKVLPNILIGNLDQAMQELHSDCASRN